MTPVPMGVDLERLASAQDAPEPFRRMLAGHHYFFFFFFFSCVRFLSWERSIGYGASTSCSKRLLRCASEYQMHAFC